MNNFGVYEMYYESRQIKFGMTTLALVDNKLYQQVIDSWGWGDLEGNKDYLLTVYQKLEICLSLTTFCKTILKTMMYSLGCNKIKNHYEILGHLLRIIQHNYVELSSSKIQTTVPGDMNRVSRIMELTDIFDFIKEAHDTELIKEWRVEQEQLTWSVE